MTGKLGIERDQYVRSRLRKRERRTKRDGGGKWGPFRIGCYMERTLDFIRFYFNVMGNHFRILIRRNEI